VAYVSPTLPGGIQRGGHGEVEGMALRPLSPAPVLVALPGDGLSVLLQVREQRVVAGGLLRQALHEPEWDSTSPLQAVNPTGGSFRVFQVLRAFRVRAIMTTKPVLETADDTADWTHPTDFRAGA
jgi:hypothetical protein